MDEVSDVKDLSGMSEAVLAQAIEYCVQQVHLDSLQTAIDRLRAGDTLVCEHCNHSLAKQVAACLGALDENIQAAYVCDYDPPTGLECSEEAGRALPIHLIVQATRKTAALNAVVETWDRALTRRYAELVGGRRPARMLDVQVVDNSDVVRRIGYGAMLSSQHHSPTEVWKR
ncbi:MAG TPA: hypothetical protein VL334_01375 [Anaerolineae bacterium]|nr:hypothetical protein [Anaerolineae bacterium]